MAPHAVPDLPVEIQWFILEHLPPPDIWALGQASKSWFALTQPFLYSKVRFDWTKECQPGICRLLRTLLVKPELAYHIQSLHFLGKRGKNIRDSGGPIYLHSLNVETLPEDKARGFIQSSDISQEFKDLWIEKLSERHTDALTTLVIAMTTNLSSLHMGEIFTIDNPVLGEFLRQTIYNRSPTQAALNRYHMLREVVMPERQDLDRRCDDRQPNNTADMLPLFYLPALKTLSVSIDRLDEFSWPSNAPTSNTLQSLKLQRLHECLLAPVLAATPSLERLHWEWSFVERSDDLNNVFFDRDAIIAAMRPLRDSLVELIIGLWYCPLHPQLISFDLQGSLAGLKHFSSLQRLTVPLVFLMGCSASHAVSLLNQLPPNLVKLRLTDNNTEMYECQEYHWYWDGIMDIYDDDWDICVRAMVLLKALKRARDKVPKLQEVIMDWKTQYDEYDSYILKGIDDLYYYHGIRLAWINREWPDWYY